MIRLNFLKIKSYNNQNGRTIIIKNNIKPIGLYNKALPISPFSNNNTERVDPHEGQGIPVAFLKRQTPIPLEMEFTSLIIIQIYPAMQAIEK